MATRLLHRRSTFLKSLTGLPTSAIMTPTESTSSNQQRRRPPRRNAPASGDSSGATQHRDRDARPPRNPHAKGQSSTTRPTHFLALPIGHHAGLRSAVQGLTTSWLAHDPPIDGLDPSIVVQPRRLHLTLGVMNLASNHDKGGEEKTHDLAGATRLLAELTPRIRAALERAPLRVQLGRLAVMQPDPTRAHVLYAEPDISSPDGRRLRAVCGTCRLPSISTPFPIASRTRP
jgi:activating signal cointegrator complex subunit 1